MGALGSSDNACVGTLFSVSLDPVDLEQDNFGGGQKALKSPHYTRLDVAGAKALGKMPIEECISKASLCRL